MARPKKVTEETAAVSAAEVKETEVKKTAAKKTAAKKAEPEKEETAVKADQVKEEAAKKAPAKKTAAKKAETEVTVTIQFKGRDIVAKDVLEAAKKAYMDIDPQGEIKTMDLYVKPEENVAYYAVNGVGSEDYKIQL